MVGDVLGEHDERNGDKREGDFRHALTVEQNGVFNSGLPVDDFLDCFDEGEVGVVEERGHARELAVFDEVVDEGREVDYLEVVDIESVAERREDCRGDIARADTENEGDELKGFSLLLGGAHNDGEERHEAAQQSDEVITAVDGVGVGFGDIAHSAAGEGQADECDGGPDDDGGHKFAHPLGAREVNDYGDYDIDETSEDGADDDAEIAERHCARQRVDERKGAAEEDGALEAREEQIDERTDAGAENGGGDLRRQPDDGRHRYGRGKDCEQLLNGKNEQFAYRRFVVDVVDEFHSCILP